jgi:hypothetical protein
MILAFAEPYATLRSPGSAAIAFPRSASRSNATTDAPRRWRCRMVASPSLKRPG